MHNLSQDEIDALLKRIQELTNQRDIDLTPDERKVLREVIKAWRIWQSFGIVGRVLVWCLLGLASLALAWGQLRTEVGRWLGW